MKTIEEQIIYNESLLKKVDRRCRLIELNKLIKRAYKESKEVREKIQSLVIANKFCVSCNCGTSSCPSYSTNCCYWSDLNCRGSYAYIIGE